MASFTTTHPVEHQPRPGPYLKGGRRQYKSCDHCRRNRRACDAAALGVNVFGGGNEFDKDAPKACSSCTRSKQQCTFQWLLSRPKSVLPQRVKRKIQAYSTASEQTIMKAAPSKASYESTYPNFYVDGLESTGIDPYQSAGPGLNEHMHVLSSPELQQNLHQFDMTSEWGHQPLESQNLHSSFATTCIPTGCTRASDHSPSSHWDQSENFDSIRQEALEPDIFQLYDSAAWTASSLLQPNSRPVHPCQSNCLIMENGGLSTNDSFDQDGLLGTKGASSINGVNATSRKDSVSTHQFANDNGGIFDPFNFLQESISQGTNKSLISASLLRIYYDSLENALSCWVTESNCPYQQLKRQERALLYPGMKQKVQMRGDCSVYARVCRLDEVFVPFHSQSMTKADSLRASNALYASILAFASQWSHTRNTTTLSNDVNDVSDLSPTPSTAFDGFAKSFEFLVQKSLWHECQKSLLACGDSDSFKVLFARIIFSMTQRPLAIEERKKLLEPHIGSQNLVTDRHSLSRAPNLSTTSRHSANFSSSDMSGGLEQQHSAQIDGNDWDSPVTYLDTALRCLALWRRRMTAQGSSETHAISSDQAAQIPHLFDLQSFDMLFWLGVMCDTTLSALNQRPLVIAEDDCELSKVTSSRALPLHQNTYAHMSYTYDFRDNNGGTATSELWGTYLLSSQRLSGDKTRWPCSTDEAFAILQEAIPVKVLLWRRVASLQTLRNVRTVERDIEDLISSTLSVYQHWTVAYGQFMRDCVADHENLPAKVQSWYVILALHWHLGCLLATNCIEWIDNDSLSESLQRSLRRSSGLVLELKKANCDAISDLARVSCSNDRQAFRDSAEFHPALSETPLLTEPWTNVIIQALEEACSVFFTWISSRRHVLDEHHDWVYHKINHSDLCSRASSCINGLKLLGQKSDAASLAGAALETQLNLITSDRGLYVPSIWTDNGAVHRIGGLD